MEKQNSQPGNETKLLTLSEFRRELGIPLILAKKLLVLGEIGVVRAVDGTIRIAAPEVAIAKKLIGTPLSRARLFVKALGPGLVTGASDDDPGGIGTYSSVGAAFGLSILWMAAWLLPVMTAIQEVCARIGVVTNKGLAGVLKLHYNRKVLISAVTLLLIANIVNIGADLGAMAASIGMFTNVSFYMIIIVLTAVITLLEILVEYHLYVRVLKFLTISVFAYIATGIMANPHWIDVLKNAFVPHLSLNKDYLFAMVAVFGTTITPYLFFWQASEEVEEGKLLTGSKHMKRGMRDRITHMRTDVYTGMLLANVVFFFIVLTTAQVLFTHGITNIDSAQDAALALAPFAGKHAAALFAMGIIGTGLLAIPVLAGSGAYALAEVLNWNEGLELKFSQAKGFYVVIALSIIFGGLFNFFSINPITALYYSAFLNGVIAVPLLYLIMKVGDDPKVMGEERHPGWVRIFGWLGVLAMAVALVVMVIMSVL
ncbi:MAG TPA: divalent metal cation transporter [Patescibacteria group bacterium]